MKRPLKFVAKWLGLAVAFGLIACLGFRVPQLALLTSRALTTSGTVTAIDPSNHGSVTVRYSVQGRNYEQSFAPHNSQPGASVTVYYQSNNPDNAELSDPRKVLENNLLVCAFAAIVFPSLTLASCLIKPLHWPWMWVSSTPRFIIIGAVTCAVISTVINVYLGTIHGRQWISTALVLGGAALLVLRTLETPREAGWKTVVWSRLFMLGLFLVVAGQLVRSIYAP